MGDGLPPRGSTRRNQQLYGKEGALFNAKDTMFAVAVLLAGSIAAAVVNVPAAGAPPEIHCKHFFYGYPLGAPATNDLIIREIYALSSNDETKFADWVTYRFDADTVTGDVETTRNWQTDPWLDDAETLEAKPDDYLNAYSVLKTDRGHQAPLASFKGTPYWADTNYYSNITPQKSDLNQGPWEKLEGKERGLASNGYTVYVMTGPLYEREMPPLPKADEAHRVPSGYWKIVAVQEGDDASSIHLAGFIFDQDTTRNEPILNHLVTVDEIERRSGLDVMRELPDDVEATLESTVQHDWAEANF